MATLRPFLAYRPPPADAVRVASPPYDVINTAEARALAEGNPASFLHVSRPEIDLPEGTDDHADEVYAKGRENLATLIEQRALVQDPEPHLYLYAQKMGSHRQTGVVACASVAEYMADTIKKHVRRAPTRRTIALATSRSWARTTSRCSSRTAPTRASTRSWPTR